MFSTLLSNNTPTGIDVFAATHDDTRMCRMRSVDGRHVDCQFLGLFTKTQSKRYFCSRKLAARILLRLAVTLFP